MVRNALCPFAVGRVAELGTATAGSLGEYSCCYLLYVLLELVTVCAWGLCAMEVFDALPLGNLSPHIAALLGKTLIYGLTSLSIRAAWNTMIFIHRLLVCEEFVKKVLREKEKREKGIG